MYIFLGYKDKNKRVGIFWDEDKNKLFSCEMQGLKEYIKDCRNLELVRGEVLGTQGRLEGYSCLDSKNVKWVLIGRVENKYVLRNILGDVFEGTIDDIKKQGHYQYLANCFLVVKGGKAYLRLKKGVVNKQAVENSRKKWEHGDAFEEKKAKLEQGLRQLDSRKEVELPFSRDNMVKVKKSVKPQQEKVIVPVKESVQEYVKEDVKRVGSVNRWTYNEGITREFLKDKFLFNSVEVIDTPDDEVKYLNMLIEGFIDMAYGLGVSIGEIGNNSLHLVITKLKKECSIFKIDKNTLYISSELFEDNFGYEYCKAFSRRFLTEKTDEFKKCLGYLQDCELFNLCENRVDTCFYVHLCLYVKYILLVEGTENTLFTESIRHRNNDLDVVLDEDIMQCIKDVIQSGRVM